ncbi:hypothetical protein Tco_1090103 [Tanacetum coccineum]|uniref:Transposase (Putative), gypsy type n=1 Tax=Tanacetum coccineum TaxID=301880 RepID=A0ABQ5I3B7_9ASTR
MGRDTIQLENAVSTISEEYLLEFTSEYGIPESLHPELPGPGDPIVEFPEGKVGVYTRFFEFANHRIPISQFLFDILGYYQIHLSHLLVIGAAKVSHIEINCHVQNIIPTLNLFRVFYVPSFNSGWMSFRKRPGKNTPQCYIKLLDSLKNWNNRFFWVDERIFLTVVEWRTNVPKDGMPLAGSYFAADVTALNTHCTPFQKTTRNPIMPSRAESELLSGARRSNDSCVITEMDLFNLISTPNPAKVKTGTRPRAAHEVPLLTATSSRVIDMEDIAVVSGSSGTPSTIEKSPLDFDNENPTPSITEGVGRRIKPRTDWHMRHRKRGDNEAEANAPPKVLRKDHAAFRPVQSTLGGKSLAAMGLAAGSTVTPIIQGTSAGAKSVSDPDPLSYTEPPPHPEQDVAQSSRKAAPEVPAEDVATTEVQGVFSVESPGSGKSAFIPSVDRSPGGIYQPSHEETAEAKNAELAKELESLRVQFLDLQVDKNQLSQQASNLQAQITGEEKIKAAFEEFKKYEDSRVEKRCAEMDARLDKLCVDFDEELYSHMLTAFAGRRWVIGHGLRLAVMKCAEYLELRQAFANVVFSGLMKGMSEGLEHDIEHEKAGRDLAVVEAYDPKADSKYVKGLQDLKDLKYSLVDQLEKLKDAPIDLIMASLHIESDSREDAP